MGGEKISFPSYCTAFSLIDSDAWRMLDSGGGDQSYGTDVMYRGKVGDGIIEIPEYRLVQGKSRKVGTIFLNHLGNVVAKRDDGSQEELGNIDAETAQYFIAGAFGMKELPAGITLDRTIVDGLAKVYSACKKDWEICKDTPTAKLVGERWQAIQAGRDKLEKLRQTVLKMQSEFDNLAKQIRKQSELISKTAVYDRDMVANPSSEADYQKNITQLRKKTAMAKIIIEEEAKALAEQKSRDEKADKRTKINEYSNEMTTMRDKINKEEGSYYRFTNAYDEAMKCMPTPTTLEERYCVAKNKYEMARWLLVEAKDFSPFSRCLEYKPNPNAGKCYSYEVVEKGAKSCTDRAPDEICVTSQEPISEESLKQYVKEFCSTICK